MSAYVSSPGASAGSAATYEEECSKIIYDGNKPKSRLSNPHNFIFKQINSSSAWSVFLSMTIFIITPQQILTIVMSNMVVNKRADHAKPLLICFFTTIWRSKFLSHPCLTASKGITWHSIVCTLIDNNKMANHIATLLPIVIKIQSGLWAFSLK